MTRTYDDTDALTRLLEEKERDLELAAHIGKSLLEDKRTLLERIDSLEQDLQAIQEINTQLRHDLTKKSNLLSIYMEGEDESPAGEEPPSSLDLLQKKIHDLENENERLKNESQSWTDDLAQEEERESELINECVRELNERNKTAARLQEELTKKTESILKQQDETSQLLGQIVDLQKKNRELSIENETLRLKMEVMAETQQELTMEVSDGKDKYETLFCAFQELQEEFRLRKQRASVGSTCNMGSFGKSVSGAGNQAGTPGSVQHKNLSQSSHGAYTKYINPDSLAAELSMSLRTENSEGYHSDDRAPTASTSNPTPRTPNRRANGAQTLSRRPVSGEFEGISDEGESLGPESYITDDDSQYSSLSSIGQNPVHGRHPLGLDLNSPMKGIMGRSFYDLDEDPTSRCRTPDSILSSFNGFGSNHSTTSSTRRYRMPDKLQIIKPLEGSQTLHKWRKLATPTPLGLIGREERLEGVKTRTVPKSPPAIVKEMSPKPPTSLDIKSFLDEVAIDEPAFQPGKSFQQSSCIYTYSTSHVLHPDATNTTSSLEPIKMASNAPQSRSPVQATASVLNRSSYLTATATCSINRGLARVLNERGIHAMLPSVLRERSEEDEDISATSTPAPSPDKTPPGTPPNEQNESQIDNLMPDLVRENRVKGVVLRSYRVEGKAEPLASTAERRELLRTKRPSQGLDTDGLVNKLSRLVQWPFGGFNFEENGNNTKVSSSSTTVITTTMTESISSVIPIVSSSLSSSGTYTSPSSVCVSSTVPILASPLMTPTGQPRNIGFVPPTGFGTGGASTLSPSMRLPLAKTPNPLLQINVGRGRPIGTVSSMRNMRKGALM